MNFKNIEQKVLSLCPYIKEIFIEKKDGKLFATIVPNFETLKSANIINIESEIRWYGVELYNLEAQESQKILGYEILKEVQNERKEREPNDEIYQSLKSFLYKMSQKQVRSNSHLELDLGLDSLDYVELFVFIEQSYGVYIDEKIFSHAMVLKDLYSYIKSHKAFVKPSRVDWGDILNEEKDDKLIFSPINMFLYKTLLYPLFRLYFSLEVKGIENIPKGSCIIAPNHQSMLDGFLIESTLPYSVLKNTFFLAFTQVFGTKLLHPIATYGQTILIDANIDLKDTMQRAALPLKMGKNLVIFPEGARTRDRKLLEFRPFFAMLSSIHSVPIVPVIIDGSFEALPSGKLFPRPKKIKLQYLEPIYPKDMSYDELTQLVKSSIEKNL
ncbi:MAG: 1-acyl-sn-glycerol-3-phosphate acyltransferase [Sulfurimonas sp.]|uniref:1-acyl-sn-glycerol-3-phosphate acyltransferase n=1 Tax=Sulfurimonas sp. TaxID=2022749 RepID=UPI0025E948DD|nr:1-acyl-sn-glycerol-3-phosphate acyltransferase [Sulfurimonas sp.]MCK9492577.1 1-acyl-sn-glycerol-3-phosphate acyltransferase [Sulfurimonas sp.]